MNEAMNACVCACICKWMYAFETKNTKVLHGYYIRRRRKLLLLQLPLYHYFCFLMLSYSLSLSLYYFLCLRVGLLDTWSLLTAVLVVFIWFQLLKSNTMLCFYGLCARIRTYVCMSFC